MVLWRLGAPGGHGGSPEGQSRASQSGPVPLPWPGSKAAPGIRQLPRMGMGHGQAGTWACRCAWLSRAHGRAGQDCGELETSPAAVLLGQGLMALGG